QLPECARGSEKQGGQTQGGRQCPGTRLIRGLDHGLDGQSSGIPEQSAQLDIDFVRGGLPPENESRHGDGNEKKRRNRENRVVRKRGRKAGGLVRTPFLCGFFDYRQKQLEPESVSTGNAFRKQRGIRSYGHCATPLQRAQRVVRRPRKNVRIHMARKTKKSTLAMVAARPAIPHTPRKAA